jgi:hypothetical protein
MAQLALYLPERLNGVPCENGTPPIPVTVRVRRSAEPHQPTLCAACRGREARYGFRDAGDDPSLGRPRTLCFDCFRAEVNRRQAVAARLARGWNAAQTPLPLQDTLESLRRRRGRAQIAARKALQLR